MKTIMLMIAVLCISTTLNSQIELFEDDRISFGLNTNTSENHYSFKSENLSGKRVGNLLRGNFTDATSDWNINLLSEMKNVNARFAAGIWQKMTGTITGWSIGAYIFDTSTTNYHKWNLRIYSSGKSTNNNRTLWGIGNRDLSSGYRSKFGLHNTIENKNNQNIYGVYNKLSSVNAARNDFIYGVNNLIQIEGSTLNSTAHGFHNHIISDKPDVTLKGNYSKIELFDVPKFAYGFHSEITRAPELHVPSGVIYGIYSSVPAVAGSYAGFFSGNVLVNGTVFETSDENLKTEIKELNQDLDPIEIINKIDAKSYYLKRDMNSNSKKRSYGFLAQDLKMILPELVTEVDIPKERTQIEKFRSEITEDSIETIPPLIEPEFDKSYAVQYNSFIPILTEALKNYMEITDSRIEDLEDGNTTGTGTNDNLNLDEILSRITILEQKFNEWSNCYDCEGNDGKSVDFNNASEANKVIQISLSKESGITLSYEDDIIRVYSDKLEFSILIYDQTDNLLNNANDFRKEHVISRKLLGNNRLIKVEAIISKQDLTKSETFVITL